MNRERSVRSSTRRSATGACPDATPSRDTLASVDVNSHSTEPRSARAPSSAAAPPPYMVDRGTKNVGKGCSDPCAGPSSARSGYDSGRTSVRTRTAVDPSAGHDTPSSTPRTAPRAPRADVPSLGSSRLPSTSASSRPSSARGVSSTPSASPAVARGGSTSREEPVYTGDARHSPRASPVTAGALSAEEVSRWTVERVQRWLTAVGLAKHTETFGVNEVDGPLLLTLVPADLRDELCITSLAERRELWRTLSTNLPMASRSPPSKSSSHVTGRLADEDVDLIQMLVEAEVSRAQASLRYDLASLSDKMDKLSEQIAAVASRDS